MEPCGVGRAAGDESRLYDQARAEAERRAARSAGRQGASPGPATRS